jgi:hypothetical protein
MRSHRAFSTDQRGGRGSPLVAAFIERSTATPVSAWDVIRDRVSALQQGVYGENVDGFLMNCARARNVVEIVKRDDIGCDGFIEPVEPSCIAKGYRVVLRTGAPPARRRFTLAHEICHTFFYETVPALKLAATQDDPFEEALCNYGAGCLLMPERVIRDSVLANRPCLDSLDRLCNQFRVSREAMILRLRQLRLWTCEYSLWHAMTDGRFVIDRAYGRTRIAWNWAETSVLERAWRSRRLCRGEAILWRETTKGLATRTVHYEVRRRGESVVALWDDVRLFEEQPPLFSDAQSDAAAG